MEGDDHSSTVSLSRKRRRQRQLDRKKQLSSIASTADYASSSQSLRATSMAWRAVNVHLGNGNDSDDTKNHYDDVRLMKQAKNDLPVNPGEEVGIFLGLEVLDGNQYDLVYDPETNAKHLVGKDDESKNQMPDTEVNGSKKRKFQETTTAAATKSRVEEQQMREDVDAKKEKEKAWKNESTNFCQDKMYSSSSEAVQKKTLSAPRKATDEDSEVDIKAMMELQLAWSHASGGATFHPQIYKALMKLGFVSPTPIQAATICAAMFGKRNVVGAAPTGSGKTLAFLLPILQHLLEAPEGEVKAIQALIVTPTRELATQILRECEKLVPGKCVALVGGIALVKQARLLSTKQPPIVIGTPGRLWAMISSQAYDHLQDLSQIRYLVIDEADRMIQEHSFPQLLKIITAIHQANPGFDNNNDGSSDDSDPHNDDEHRMLGLPGIRGEASVTMLTDDLLRRIQVQREFTNANAIEVKEEEDLILANDVEGSTDISAFDETGILQKEAYVHRQTFIYSATLTLPFTSTKSSLSLPQKRQKKNKHPNLTGDIMEILEKTRAMGKTKVVDLSTSSSSKMASSTNMRKAKALNANCVQMPPGLALEQLKCTQRHKDSHLYAYLMTTTQGASGPSLVFCNSIAAVRRVGTTLQTLEMPVRILHAHMQQRARFKAIESLNNSSSRAVVVCTDVAARGLDIPSVSSVIHYDVARSVDTFVHRSGRTARGVGEDAIGSSLSLISPADEKAHRKITEALNATFSKVLLDGRLMKDAQERTNLASKVVMASVLDKRTRSRNQWFLEKANEADLELDEALIDNDDSRPPKERQQLEEARKAKAKLQKLLKLPMKTQRFRKFLFPNDAAFQEVAQPLPSSARMLSNKKKA